jgi:hypothetical protein
VVSLLWAAPAAPSYVGAQAALSASGQSISYTSGVETIISFGSENFDTDGFHSTSTNTSRMTIPSGKGGKYLFTGTLFLNTVPNYARLTLAKNGTFIREVLSYGGRIGSLVNAGSGNEPVIGNMITQQQQQIILNWLFKLMLLLELIPLTAHLLLHI